MPADLWFTISVKQRIRLDRVEAVKLDGAYSVVTCAGRDYPCSAAKAARVHALVGGAREAT